MSSIAMTILVRDGQLTTDGAALAKYLRADYAEMRDSIDRLPDEHRRAYHVLVNRRQQVTPEQFFMAYPRAANHLWFTYAANLPADHPRRVQAEIESLPADDPTPAEIVESLQDMRVRVVQLVEQWNGKPNEPSLSDIFHRQWEIQEASMDLLPLVEGSGQYAQLTTRGEFVLRNLHQALKSGAAVEEPYIEALQALQAYTQQRHGGQALMTEAEFIATFPAHAAQLHRLVYRLWEMRADRYEKAVRRQKMGTPNAAISRL